MKIVLLLLVIMGMILLHGCENKESAPVDLRLYMSPDTLLLNDKDTLVEVFISVTPKWKCNFKVTQQPSWLKITPKEGVIDGSMVPLTIQTIRAGFIGGTYSGDISIISDLGGSSEMKVFMTVIDHPEIKTDISSINFAENISYKDLTIRNTGKGPLQWSVSKYPNWLSFSSSYGSIPAGSYKIIGITCNRAGLDANIYTDSIKITSNSDISFEPIPVTMIVPASISLEVPANLLFNEAAEKMEIVVKNTSNTGITWNAVQGDYLNLSTAGGTLARGESQTIEVSVDRTSMQTGTYESSVKFSYGGSTKTIPVQIKNYVSNLWGIEGIVTDAEFCRETNRIILVTTNPNRLSVIDPDSKTVETINLNSVPKCVAVNKTGDKAVVGHNGMITYVSITGKSIEKESPVSCNILDILFTSTNWVYTFPSNTPSSRIICINPLTGVETPHTGSSIYAGMLGGLHPSEKWIYGADNGLSPSDIRKLNIENGTAVYSYDSPYHGDYPMGGNLWFSEGGERIFTRGKTVLRISEDRASDMLYNGSLPATGSIWALFHSALANKVFYITYSSSFGVNTPNAVLNVCNYSYLTFIKSYPLDKFVIPDIISGNRFFSSEGHFVFANKEGTKVYVVVRAEKNSGLLNDWAIQTVNID